MTCPSGGEGCVGTTEVSPRSYKPISGGSRLQPGFQTPDPVLLTHSTCLWHHTPRVCQSRTSNCHLSHSCTPSASIGPQGSMGSRRGCPALQELVRLWWWGFCQCRKMVWAQDQELVGSISGSLEAALGRPRTCLWGWRRSCLIDILPLRALSPTAFFPFSLQNKPPAFKSDHRWELPNRNL